MDKEQLYKHSALSLLPKGPIWNGNVLKQFVSAIGKDAKLTDDSIEILINNMSVKGIKEFLKEYEFMYGLPDSCDTESTSLKEKRSSILLKLSKKQIPTVRWIENFASFLGYKIKVITHKHFIAGLSKVGERLGAYTGTIGIEIYNKRKVRFMCSASRCGESLCKINQVLDLKCRLNKKLPIDKELVFLYTG